MNVIYIDDDANNRAVLAEMFAVGQLRMAEAPDADTGLRMLEQERYDLVLIDLRMPGINGLTAIRRLRARGGDHGNVPIVVVTADLTEGVQRMCRDAGADGFLAKPVAMDALFDRVAAIMASGRDTVLN